MKRLQVISLILALVMSIQMLPLAQIGYALSSNQWTEELPHGNAEDVSKCEPGLKNILAPSLYQFTVNVSFIAANLYIHNSEQIPTNHSTDIVSPPPDAA